MDCSVIMSIQIKIVGFIRSEVLREKRIAIDVIALRIWVVEGINSKVHGECNESAKTCAGAKAHDSMTKQARIF